MGSDFEKMGEYDDAFKDGVESERDRIIKKLKSKLLTKGRRPNRTYIKGVLNSF